METKKQTDQMLFDIITKHFAPLQEKKDCWRFLL